MSDLATKMSLSATSDKAKHQGPSSCHVLTGAWGKTPSGAGKYFPNRHPRKHRFHQMVKSAVATACMLLAFVCQIATASQFDAKAFIKKKVREYILKTPDLQGLEHIKIDSTAYHAIFEGDQQYKNNAKMINKMWSHGGQPSSLTAEFQKIFDERIAEAANRIAEAERRIAEAEAMKEQTTNQVLQQTTNQVANEMLDDHVEYAANEYVKLLKEKRRKELADKFREFDVVKTKMNTDDQSLTGVKGRKFHFGLSKDVLQGEMLKVFPYSPETPIVYYEGGSKKCFIAVKRFESYRSHTVSFPKSEKKYQRQGYKTSICYKARGTCYEYKDNSWEKNNSRKKKDEKDDESFVAFWVKNSSGIDIEILNEYLAMLPPKLELTM